MSVPVGSSSTTPDEGRRGLRGLLALPVWWLCSAVDWLPHFDRIDHRWYRHGGHGCYPLHISGLALRIEGERHGN